MTLKEIKNILEGLNQLNQNQTQTLNQNQLNQIYNVATKIASYLDKNLKTFFPNIKNVYSDKSNIIIKNGGNVLLKNKEEFNSAIQQLIVAVIGSYGLKKYKIVGPIKLNNDAILTITLA